MFLVNQNIDLIGGITELSRPGFSKTLVFKLGFKNTELGLT